MDKSVMITGATGLIGRNVVEELCSKGSFVKILTTNKDKARKLFKKHFTIQIFEWEKYDDPFSLSNIINESDLSLIHI